MTVVPRGVGPRFRYRLSAMAWALGLWWSGLSSATVRERVSPCREVGAEAQRYWERPRRWVEAFGAALGLRRSGGVEMVLQRLAAQARSATGDLIRDAVQGVAFVDVHRRRRGGPEVPTI